jgi:hypothetical protein
MGHLHKIECDECEFEKTMINDEYAQCIAEKHESKTDHAVSVRDLSSNRTFVSPLS